MNDDSKIVDLPARIKDAERVWKCKCETLSFYVHSNKRLQCCGCGTFQNTGLGAWFIPEYEEAAVTAFPAPDSRSARSEE